MAVYTASPGKADGRGAQLSWVSCCEVSDLGVTGLDWWGTAATFHCVDPVLSFSFSLFALFLAVCYLNLTLGHCKILCRLHNTF